MSTHSHSSRLHHGSQGSQSSDSSSSSYRQTQRQTQSPYPPIHSHSHSHSAHNPLPLSAPQYHQSGQLPPPAYVLRHHPYPEHRRSSTSNTNIFPQPTHATPPGHSGHSGRSGSRQRPPRKSNSGHLPLMTHSPLPSASLSDLSQPMSGGSVHGTISLLADVALERARNNPRRQHQSSHPHQNQHQHQHHHHHHHHHHTQAQHTLPHRQHSFDRSRVESGPAGAGRLKMVDGQRGASGGGAYRSMSADRGPSTHATRSWSPFREGNPTSTRGPSRHPLSGLTLDKTYAPYIPGKFEQDVRRILDTPPIAATPPSHQQQNQQSPPRRNSTDYTPPQWPPHQTQLHGRAQAGAGRAWTVSLESDPKSTTPLSGVVAMDKDDRMEGPSGGYEPYPQPSSMDIDPVEKELIPSSPLRAVDATPRVGDTEMTATPDHSMNTPRPTPISMSMSDTPTSGNSVPSDYVSSTSREEESDRYDELDGLPTAVSLNHGCHKVPTRRSTRNSTCSSISSSVSLPLLSKVKVETPSPTRSAPNMSREYSEATTANSVEDGGAGKKPRGRSEPLHSLSSGSASIGKAKARKSYRRDGVKRREQNAVAQKRFRTKKKVMAEQMASELEVNRAKLAATEKEVANLRQELTSLKRKVKEMSEG